MTRTTTVAVVLLAAIAQASWADTVNLATGLDASNNRITSGGVIDAHWTATPDPTFDPTGTAQTVFPNNADWFGGSPAWLANGPNSDWIARNANVTDNGPFPYSFNRTFDLTGFNPATATISGAWAVDDTGTLSLNGHQIASLGNTQWGALTPFSVAAGSGFFNAGLNTLTITITGTDRFLEGVRLEGTLTETTTAVPEPSSVLLTAVAVVAGGLVRWRWRAR